jgi:HAD superfamily hydrolase (TIGR01509 family)
VTKIHFILFDLGNVLAHIDFDAFWRSLGFSTPEAAAPWKGEYASWTLQYETGRIRSDEYLDGLARIFNSRFTREQLERAVDSIIEEPVEGMLELVQHVSRGHQTALVSNTSEAHYSLSLKRFDALPLLQKHYLSFQLHVMKPDRKFYEAIIRDLQADPSEMLFIDDIEENIAGARAAGMQAVRFEGVEKLKDTLKHML